MPVRRGRNRFRLSTGKTLLHLTAPPGVGTLGKRGLPWTPAELPKAVRGGRIARKPLLKNDLWNLQCVGVALPAEKTCDAATARWYAFSLDKPCPGRWLPISARCCQNPRVAFRDPQLQQCSILKNTQNQPRPWAGAFAVVYKGLSASGRAPFAVRVFYHRIAGATRAIRPGQFLPEGPQAEVSGQLRIPRSGHPLGG